MTLLQNLLQYWKDGWGPLTVDEDLSSVLWTWLSAAARWLAGSSSKETIRFIIKVKSKYVQGLKNKSEMCQLQKPF